MIALPSSGLALTDDEAFLAAREAFQKGNIEHLSQLAPELRDYPLYPYVAYWQLRSRLPEASTPVVEAFISDYRDTLLAERVRADWLRTLARNQDWEAFEREYRKLAVEDVELTCYALQATLALRKDQGALKDARALWFQGSVQPDSCAPLFDAMLRQGLLEEDDVWARIRLALESGNVSFVRQLVSYLPTGRRPDPRLFDAVARNPQRYLDRSPVRTNTRAERELAMFAVVRLAQSLPSVAATRFEKIQPSLMGEEQAYVWGQLGLAGAMKHRPEALDWFARAGERLSDRQLNWKVRAALRKGEWGTALAAVEAMSSPHFRSTITSMDSWRWKSSAASLPLHPIPIIRARTRWRRWSMCQASSARSSSISSACATRGRWNGVGPRARSRTRNCSPRPK
jgi:soluble lytic murein transglycosylase